MQSFLNGAVSALFSTFVVLGAGQTDVVKPSEPLVASCEYALVPRDAFDKVLAAAEKSEEKLLSENESELDAAMEELEIESAEERLAYKGAVKLKPLLTSGVLYEAIASEAVARGHKSARDVESLVRNFALLPLAEKRAMIDGVLESLLFNLDDQINFENIKMVRQRAERFKMTEEDFSRFLRSWRKLAASDYEEAKLVILDILRDPTAAVIQSVVKARKKYAGFNWFKKKAPFRPVLEVGENGEYDTASLEIYFEETHTGMQTRFLKMHWRELTLEQIGLVQKTKAWGKLPESLRNEIVSETKANAKLYALRSELKKKEKRLTEAQSELVELKEETALHPTTVNVEDVVRMIQVVRRQNDGHAYISIRQTVADNAKKLSSSDFVKVAEAIITECVHINSYGVPVKVLQQALPEFQAKKMEERDFVQVAVAVVHAVRRINDGHAYLVLKHVVESAKLRKGLSLTAESAIKQAITQEVSGFSDYGWPAKALALISGPLNRSRPKSVMELEDEIAELKRDLNEIRKNLAETAPSVDELNAAKIKDLPPGNDEP